MRRRVLLAFKRLVLQPLLEFASQLASFVHASDFYLGCQSHEVGRIAVPFIAKSAFLFELN